MLAGLPSTVDDKTTEEKEDQRMVTLVVTIDEELLRRIETYGYPDIAAEPTKAEAPPKNGPG